MTMLVINELFEGKRKYKTQYYRRNKKNSKMMNRKLPNILEIYHDLKLRNINTKLLRLYLKIIIISNLQNQFF